MDSDEDDFGPVVPPLSDFIRAILRKYPDGSQLKELLQNAEDAGASVVKFLYDGNHYRKNNLFHPSLKVCQGPSLCAYNNAKFQPCDWKGIQQPQRSHKSDSMLKVGKFGIGFNSVYHVSDMPWILSGDKLAIMEPTESLFNGEMREVVRHRSGFDWRLKRPNHRKEILASLDQFNPIEAAARVVNVGFLQEWNFEGTLFRLPLRTGKSSLSSTIYTEAMITELFEKFHEDEMEEILLFLSNLEDIEILKSETSVKATTLAKVSICEEDIDEIREKRRELTEAVNGIAASREEDEEIEDDMTNNMTLRIDFENDKRTEQSTWIVSHYIPAHSNAPNSWHLAAEESVKRLPWVSMAANIDVTTTGRTFCFLPLPKNSENETGLPVHINAYFGLEDNRRNLKWPSSDQARAPEALWNAALVTEVIPVAYVQLIRFCIDKYDVNSYFLWPKMDQVHQRWKAILPPFYKLLFEEPVLKISCPGGEWTSINPNIYIDNLSEKCDERIAKAVRRCLNLAKAPYVHVPANVLEGVKHYSKLYPVEVNYLDCKIVKNQLVKKQLSISSIWDQISSADRLLLLQYFVEHATSKNVAAYIAELPIIPLANGEFAKLNDKKYSGFNSLYLASKTYENLLPNMSGAIIDVTNLPITVKNFFKKIIDDPKYRIGEIDEDNFPIILRKCLPDSWKPDNSNYITFNLNGITFPNRKWLTELWIHLQKTYPHDLSKFEGLTLLESGSNLLTLPKKCKSCLFVKDSFSKRLENLLATANAIAVPSSLLALHSKLASYIYKGSVLNLIDLMENCGISNFNSTLKSDALARNVLLEFLATHRDELRSADRNLIQRLPLFELLRIPRKWSHMNIGKSGKSIEECLALSNEVYAITFEGLPDLVSPNESYLDCSRNEHNILRRWLNIKAISQEEIANKVIENRNSYTPNDFSKLMIWAFDYIHPQKIRSSLMNHKFIPSDNGQYYAPSELFDPHVAALKNLFLDELGRFPSSDYNNIKIVEILRGLGLKTTVNELTAAHILDTARTIHRIGLKHQAKLDIFYQLIPAHFYKLSLQQITELKSFKLFQAKKTRPQGYPANLNWFGSENQNQLYSTQQMAKQDCALIVGSVVPIVDVPIPTQLNFAERSNINSECVIMHLEIIANNYAILNRFQLESMLYECYKLLAEKNHAEIRNCLNTRGFKQWIWTGTAFVDPLVVVANWIFYKTGLEPYMYCLPNFLQEVNLLAFFADLGVQLDDGICIGRNVLQEIKNKHESGVSLVNLASSRVDFSYVRSILEVLAENPGQEVEIPIKQNGDRLKFHLATECKFNDCGSQEELMLDYQDQDEGEDEIFITHSDLPIELCRRLGAKPLSNAALDAEEYEQHESMLQRLKNILEEYPAGATIFQELLQNADDAGANKIGFLLDMRENSKWRQSVFRSGLDKFQGPALWVYNDAVFTDDDFKNLLSVGGATKRNNCEKIGSFGVGFNSVYHLTDMPCFISRNYLAILDPHKHCLPKAGMRYDLKKNPKKLEFKAHQFLPYQGVFGCDLKYKREGANYQNTLFRLPLRDSDMARSSQLSENSYDLFKMQDLLVTFAQTADFVMLFIQHVHTLELSYLASNCQNPQDKQTPLHIIKNITSTNSLTQDSLIKTVKTNIQSNRRSSSLHVTNLLEISVISATNSLQISNVKGTSTKKWIQQWSASEGSAYQLAFSAEGREAGLMPVVAIAAYLKAVGVNKYLVESTPGFAFCYLPLPVITGLPFHLHAPFALAANRRHLWSENVRDLSSLKTRWNEALKTEALVTCLIKLLESLKALDAGGTLDNYKFYSLWPIKEVVHEEFSGFVVCVYNQLVSMDKQLWKSVEGRWISFAQSRFLILSTQWPTNFREAAQRATQNALQMSGTGCTLVDISPEVRITLQNNFGSSFSDKSYTDEKFFTEIFFPYINVSTDVNLSNEILLGILKSVEAQKPYLSNLLQQIACIPVTPDGRNRVRPSDLIDINSEIHNLYFENENKFAREPFQAPEIRRKLIQLGMRTYATGEMLLERAQTVQTLFNQRLLNEAKCRSKLILNFLTGSKISDSIYDECANIPFVFAMSKPQDWTLPWYNSNQEDGTLYRPQEMLSNGAKLTNCFVAPVLDVTDVRNWQQLEYQLGVSRRTPSPDKILRQLQILAQIAPPSFTHQQFDMAQKVILDCFKTLQNSYRTSTEYLQPFINDFSKLPILLFKPAAFVSNNYVCSEATQENYAPFLYSIKGTAYDRYSELLQLFGVKQSFSIEDYVDAMQRMKNAFGENPLPPPFLQTAVHLCKKISDCISRQEPLSGELFLPDQDGCLVTVSRLTFWELDMTEIPPELLEESRLCCRNIPRDIALNLGIRLQRTVIAERFYIPLKGAESFGQHEELTTRISNILDEYNNKSDVINEMIQNADDAGATEIHFILDCRQLPTNSEMLSDNWKELQGPSLVVRNDKPFEEKDFNGIRNLGLGSKRADPNLTGKFGIGFNTVYHLTDVPMFISNNETMCVLDPHMKYVPIATSKEPGGKFELHEHFRRIYDNILQGFKPVKDLRFENSTVFRLPLRRRGQAIPSEIADSVDLKYIMEMFIKFESNAEEYFFFLKNIETIRVSYVDENGKLCRNELFYSELSKKDREKKKAFSQIVAINEPRTEDAVVDYKMTICSSLKLDKGNKPEKYNWRIFQRLSCLKDEMPTEVAELKESGKLTALPLVGLAMPLYRNDKSKRTYTTLPLPEENKLPVHVNGKFMLDQGRKHCYLDGTGYKREWNEYLITKVLAPLYIQALQFLKNNVMEDWPKTLSDNKNNIKFQQALVKKYQHYLPTSSHKQPIGQVLLKEVYRLLHNNKLQLVFGIKIDCDCYFKRNLMWLSTSDGTMDILVAKKQEQQQFVRLTSGVPTVVTSTKPTLTEVDHIRSILEIVHFPKFDLGFNSVVKEICSTMEIKPNEISPQCVAEHMKNVEDKLILVSGEEKLPVLLKRTVLSNDQIKHCLSFILEAENMDLENVPLLRTADNKLRRFSANYEVYPIKYCCLLPKQGKLFCNFITCSKIPEVYCRKFDVSILARHLPLELPDLFGDCLKKPSHNEKKLIYDILDFLAEFDYNKENLRELLVTHVQPIQECALLPTSVLDLEGNGNNFLVTLKYASLVIFPLGISDKLKALYSCLRKLGLMFVDLEIVGRFGEWDGSRRSNMINFLTNLCAEVNSPETIVKVLQSVLQNVVENASFDRINQEEKLVILDFIIENFSHPIKPNEKEVMEIIKRLPLFQTTEGNFVNLATDSKYVICKEEIEGAELDKLMDSNNLVLLDAMKLADKDQFCKNLAISLMPRMDLYATYIIPNMAKFSKIAIIKHLNCMRNFPCSKEQDDLYKQLGNTEFIEMPSGNFKAIADLYDQSLKKDFEAMLPQDSFIPEEFSNLPKELGELIYWHSFLTKLGLKTELSWSVFIDLARNLEREEKSLPHETLEKRSKILIKYLQLHCLRMMGEQKQFLNYLSPIKFIYAHAVSDELNFLHEQSSNLKGLICFRDSVLFSQQQICWTKSKLLPDWSVDYPLNNRNLINGLKYLDSPTIEDVVAHTENICNRLQKLKFEETTTTKINGRKEIQLLQTVLGEIFTFLKTNLDKKHQHLIDRLREVPCVLVEEGRLLVRPNQAVLEEFKQCPPFLYTLPENLYSYLEVLQKLGTEKKVTHRHYVSALKMFHDTFGEGPYRNPNTKKSLQTAYVGFLKQIIRNDPKDVTEEELYLPDENSCLQKSTDIYVFVETLGIDTLDNKPVKKWNTVMIKGLDESVDKFAKALLNLPTLIRPMNYSHFVTEELSADCEKCPGTEFCKDKHDISKLFLDSLFVKVVTKVINRHTFHEEGKSAKQDEIAAFFNDVRVICYTTLKTTIRDKESKKIIDEKIVPTFWTKTPNNTVEFMIAHDHADMKNNFVDKLIRLVNLVCPFKSEKDESHFRSIFDKLDLYRHQNSLKEIIKRELEQDDVEDNYLPQLGSIIPDDMIGLLDPDMFRYYKKQEYVALATGEESYIYAQIVEKIEETDTDGQLKCKYEVDIGDSRPVVKPALDIYKFVTQTQLRSEIASENSLVCVDNPSEPDNRFSRPLQEILDEVTEQLEAIWRTFDGNERKKAIRRLYLLWHPDKHPPERQEMANDVMKFIFQEVDRLEKGLPRSKRGEAEPSKFWRDNFNNWNNRAKRDQNRRKNYKRRAQDNWDYFSSPRNSEVPPTFARSLNPAAKLWCEQAKFDLETALTLIKCENKSYEWIFYICYQVARKSLVAMLYTKSTFENQNTNLMELVMDVLEAFGEDPGGVHSLVKFLVSKDVDEIRPTKPLFGKTNHENYQQCGDCCQEVVAVVVKILREAQRCTQQDMNEE